MVRSSTKFVIVGAAGPERVVGNDSQAPLVEWTGRQHLPGMRPE
jgi:hypothetical protein